VLAEQDKYHFQWWVLSLVNARPVEQKKGADHGIDGKIRFFALETAFSFRKSCASFWQICAAWRAVTGRSANPAPSIERCGDR
jgi:hypothetical protein